MTTSTSSAPATSPLVGDGHVCAWWLGPLLVSPLRRLIESPEKLLNPLVTPGMTVLEPGCGMGFFSLPIARMVGPSGKVICMDTQPRMIDGLIRRARRAGLLERIDASVCAADELRLGALEGQADLAVVAHMVHEVADGESLLSQLSRALRPGARLLFTEPRGHVSREAFERTIQAASRHELIEKDRPITRRKLLAILEKALG